MLGVPCGNRTRVPALKGQYPNRWMNETDVGRIVSLTVLYVFTSLMGVHAFDGLF